MCSGLGYHTFETVQGSPPQTSSDFSRPASKAGPLLVRAPLPPLAQPDLRRFFVVLLQLKNGGVAKAKGEGEKEKECTTECKSRRRRDLNGSVLRVLRVERIPLDYHE